MVAMKMDFMVQFSIHEHQKPVHLDKKGSETLSEIIYAEFVHLRSFQDLV